MMLKALDFYARYFISVCGSLRMKFNNQKNIEYCVDKIRNLVNLQAGAIALCVTNVSEIGCWWESSNPVYGVSKNPYDILRTPGGSSGGEAALQTAAGIPISLGMSFIQI